MDFDRIVAVVKSSDPMSFDRTLAVESGLATFLPGGPVFLENKDVTVEVSHDGMRGVTGVSVYGNRVYLKNGGAVVVEMKRVASGGAVVYSAGAGFVFRQNSGVSEPDICGSISNIGSLQEHMSGFLAGYVPVRRKPRKSYTMNSPNNGIHGRSDAHYWKNVVYGGEKMTLDEAIFQFGSEKDGRCGSRSSKSWAEGASIMSAISGFDLSLGAIKMWFYKKRDAKASA